MKTASLLLMVVVVHSARVVLQTAKRPMHIGTGRTMRITHSSVSGQLQPDTVSMPKVEIGVASITSPATPSTNVSAPLPSPAATLPTLAQQSPPAEPLDLTKMHDARAFVVSCMDFRLIDKVEEIMVKKGYQRNYDYFIIAGASLGILQQNHPEWVQTFKDHLELSMELHHVREVMFIDHLDCGYYKRLFGGHLTQMEEQAKHYQVLQKVRAIVEKGYPELVFHGQLINLFGELIKMS